MTDISRSVRKVDNKTKMSGQELYVSDIQPDNMYYAKTVRSTISHGEILDIKKPILPEDYYMIDSKDILGKNYVNMIFEDFPVFAEKTVTYIGEPILIVIGRDKEVIETIIDGIEVTYKPLDPVFDYQNSVVHYDFSKGTQPDAFEQVIEYDYHTGYQEQLYIEPQGFIGYMEEGKVVLEGSIQCPYYVKNAVNQVLNDDGSGVRIRQCTVGGAFGGKEEFPSVMACQLAIAVKITGKTIKMIYERGEDIHVTTKRHPADIRLKAYVGSEDQILGIEGYVAIDSGAHIGLSGVVLQRAMLAGSGVYTFDYLAMSGDVFETNTVPNGAFRGFGAPQMFFAIELFIHHIAIKLGKNPVEFKSIYMAKQGDLTSTSGHYRDPIILNQLIDEGMKMSDFESKIESFKEHNQLVAMSQKNNKMDKYKGIGMSWVLHGCGFTGSGEQDHIKAKVKLEKDVLDQVHILIAAVDMGQGIKTTMKKIVAHSLGIPLEQVIYDHPDTDKVPDSGPTVASRTTMIVGGLVKNAAAELKRIWKPGESQETEANYVQPDYVKWDETTLTGDAYPAYSWGVNIAEVTVDPLTYEVSMEGFWSVYDIGKAIDERIIDGQSSGGTMQAIGYALMEKMVHKDGRIQQGSVTDYVIPTAMDGVNIHTKLMDNPFALGPYGAKGAGELTLVGGAPAIAMAVENAIGRQVQKIPVVPEYIMELMKNEI